MDRALQEFPVVIIGAGSTGAALACDLALRGFPVTVLERGEVSSGTTGRNHALLHSGARYVVNDPASARECFEENRVLRRLAPEVIEPSGGLFVALDAADLDYLPKFLEGCREAGMDVRPISPRQALDQVPALNPQILAAVPVPDAVFDPYRLTASWLATAQAAGARVLTYVRVEGLEAGPPPAGVRSRAGDARARTVVRAQSLTSGRELVFPAAVVANCAGPWAPQIGALAGVKVPVVPSAGVLVALEGRLANKVINHLHPPGDGDILVPQRQISLAGTTSWVAESPDQVPVPRDHVERLRELASRLVPAARFAPLRAAYSACRPLVADNVAADGREISRGFRVFNHGQSGLFTVAGGKTATSRAMAESAGDAICAFLGVERPCRTRVTPLVSYRRFRADPWEWEVQGIGK